MLSSDTTKFFKRSILLSLLGMPLLLPVNVQAQDTFKGLESLFTVPKNYTVNFTSKAPKIDGDISDAVWARVPWTTDFKDIEGDKQANPYYPTKCKMTWDKDYLYVAAEITDPDVWAYVKKHDEVIFQDNDFEIFIDPVNTTHQYFEIEVNAINTVWELFLPKPYRNQGGGLNSWNPEGLRSAVKVQGTLNNAKDKDKGWTVEMAIPFSGLNFGSVVKSPNDGDFWRINFSRVEWGSTGVKHLYVKNKDASGKDLPEHNWVWSPQGLINMHYPERWGYLQFRTAAVGEPVAAFELPYAEKQKNYLWLAYYKQMAYFEKQGKYAQSLQELGLSNSYIVEGKRNTLVMEATVHQFFITLTAEQLKTITINQEGLIQTAK